MAVFVSGSDGQLHKKAYYKNGFPQMVFSGGNLIFPDFCMVNTGGHCHLNTGDLSCRISPYYGDFGFNNVFVPYKVDVVGDEHSKLSYNVYSTDTKVYGIDCELGDTYNLTTNNYTDEPETHGGINNVPLSSVGDCIIMKGDRLVNYIGSMTTSSKMILYTKMSANSDSIEKFKKDHNLKDSDINYDVSYNPKIKFGVCYSCIGVYEGDKYRIYDHRIDNGFPAFKKYESPNACSNRVDIECDYNTQDSTYYGYTNKYFNLMGYDNTLTKGYSSYLVREPIMVSPGTYIGDRDYVFISPNYEYHKGFVQTKNKQYSANLFVNYIYSAEFGVSFDKNPPKEIVLCDGSNNSTGHLEVESYETNPMNLTTANDGNGKQVIDFNTYPFNVQFVKDFYNYCRENGIIPDKYNTTNGDGILSQYFPNIDELKSRDSKEGNPSYWVSDYVMSPSTGVDYYYNGKKYNINNCKSGDISFNKQYYKNIEVYSPYCSNLSGFNGILQYGISNKYKRYIYTEFEAKLKFNVNYKKEIPVVLLTEDVAWYDLGDTVENLKTYLRPNYFGTYALDGKTCIYANYTYHELTNIFGDYGWEIVGNEWRKYGFFVEDNFIYNKERYTKGWYQSDVTLCIPYLSIWGEGFGINSTTNGKTRVTPYEVRNVTTKLYI